MNNKPIKFIEGKRIYLRPIENSDLDLIYASLWDKKEGGLQELKPYLVAQVFNSGLRTYPKTIAE